MLKLLATVVVYTLIINLFVDSIPRDSRQAGVGCRYLNDGNLNSKLVCNGSSIQCETIANLNSLNNTFQMFGIEALNSSDLKLRYKLYPKNLTDSVFYDSVVTTSNGTLADLVLYHSDVLIEPGLMVKNKECYSKLVRYFQIINTKISVEKMTKSSTSDAFILGYIINV